MNIRQRIYLGFVSIFIFIALFVGAVASIMMEMNGNTNEIGHDLYTKVQLTHEVQFTLGAMNEGLTNLLMDEEPDEALRTIYGARESLRSINERLAPMIETAQGKQHYGETARLYTEYEAMTDRYIRLASEGDTSAAEAMLRADIQPKGAALQASLTLFIEYQEELMMSRVETTGEQHRQGQAVMWGGVAMLLILCGVTALGVVRSSVRSIRKISDVMNEVQALDSAAALPRMKTSASDEMGVIAAAYNRMADALEEHTRQEAANSRWLEEQNWVKSNVAGVMNATQGAREIKAFGERFLAHVVPTTGAVAGALYFADPDGMPDRFARIAAYALDPAEAARERVFERGQGLVGQCAADGAVIERAAPPHYLKVVSGLGEGDAAYVTLLPIRFEDRIVAVLELGGFAPLERVVREFLTELTSGGIGVSLRALSSNMRVQALLSESQTYVEELQTQSEELQQQQEELRSLNEKLAEQFRYSEQRSLELDQIRVELEKQAGELQASSQFKSEFLANISHELRTPMNSLLILAQMLADDAEGRLSGKQREYAQTILYSGNELLGLINDVLDLSKIEAGQMEPSMESFSLDEFANAAERQFRGVAEKKGLAFDVRTDPTLADAEFVGDPRMLQQIVNNLLSNAFKFTETGTVSLRVFSEEASSGETSDGAKTVNVSFQVRDTGIGIPADKHGLIFEAFRQADGKTTRKYGGTGLGLSISKELATILGGAIRLESVEGSGSAFTATIPMKRLDRAARREAAAATASAEPRVPSGTVEEDGAENCRGKILLVDDDIRNVYALSAALLEQRYRVTFAEDGGAALAKLNEEPDIDLVLMDMMMPGIDGYEATRAIRADARFEKLPVIALTAKAMKQDRELCLEAGANDYLSKPVKLDKLLSLLRVWMDGSGGETA
ncbi:response regulator [Paenibacillus antri]|uniref:Circadian input-output histidine kinase CikA n=1 Tax=Paenibacillus antri TaxID=2582848 RepID=A0A5R9GKZ1_9BACL|nr:response regulator [Paenibacillus antri]TLS54208.1 response regulator [Paenibacillus antri]